MICANCHPQSYGTDNYTVYACYDFNPPKSQNRQTIIQSGVYQNVSSDASMITITPADNATLHFPFTPSPTKTQAGALLSFDSDTVLVRFGVSFHNSSRACMNAAEEIPHWDFDQVQKASQSKWEDVLSRISVDVHKENETIIELLYSSVSIIFQRASFSSR